MAVSLGQDSDRPPGKQQQQQTFHDDGPSTSTLHASPPANANGQTDIALRPHEQHGLVGLSSAAQDRSRPSLDRPHDHGSKERSKSGGRRPSGHHQRTCGKCQRALTGQFVRALGDTYHLECFTCHVGSAKLTIVESMQPGADICAGLRQNRRLQVLPCARSATESIPLVRNRLLQKT